MSSGECISWSNLSPDVLRDIIGSSGSLQDIQKASLVCKSWKHALDHPTVWRLFAVSRNWPVRGREWLISKHFSCTKSFGNIPLVQVLEGPGRGTAAVFAPRPRHTFCWTTGQIAPYTLHKNSMKHSCLNFDYINHDVR